VVPPHVDYCLTPLGSGLSEAFCGVWLWAEANHCKVEAARKAFDARG
jgi:DNA-binding HxlR family transcriptional regulator